jgi:hypothetical protein
MEFDMCFDKRRKDNFHFPVVTEHCSRSLKSVLSRTYFLIIEHVEPALKLVLLFMNEGMTGASYGDTGRRNLR